MAAAPPQVLTVTELTRRIKGLLEGQFRSQWVEGEISNLGIAPSGHCYFTLKDANAQLSAVMFRGAAARLNFKLADGLQVVALGEISVYEKRGQYQIIVGQLMPKGLGALQLAFEQLKKKLAAEGLFDAARKRPIPVLPQCIGLVTSPTGAAIRDFLNIIQRRFPNVHIVIYPVRVQGVGAAEEIAAAIDHLNALHAGGEHKFDVIIATRGGGSLEDLWAFNEEVVARALARSVVPTISAVGHEIDFTIADFVADLRAPTPSAAAELVVKAKDEFARLLGQQQHRLDKDLRYRVSEARRRLAHCVLRHPAEMVRQFQQQVDDLDHRLARATQGVIDGDRQRLEHLAGKLQLLTPQTIVRQLRERVSNQRHRLDAGFVRYWKETGQRLVSLSQRLDLLSPRSTLARGYSITRTPDGKLVKSIKSVKRDQRVSTLVADGQFESEVK